MDRFQHGQSLICVLAVSALFAACSVSGASKLEQPDAAAGGSGARDGGGSAGVGGTAGAGGTAGGADAAPDASGDAEDDARAEAAPVVNPYIARQVSVGVRHACALLDTGRVRCWGDGGFRQLGYGNENSIGDDETPAAAGDVAISGAVEQIAASSAHTCALKKGGTVRCWGLDQTGQLGANSLRDGGSREDDTPASWEDVKMGGAVTQISAGYMHTCALLSGGTVRCWGDGELGSLGYGNTKNIGEDLMPADVGDVNVGGTVQQISAGGFHTCALLTTGSVRCWGYGALAQLGYGNRNNIGDNETPASAGDVTVGGTVKQIAAGAYHTCALLAGGVVRCWGPGEYGQPGYANANTIGDNETPASAGNVNVGGTVLRIAAGFDHTCALLEGGTVRCWGRGGSGQLGYGNTNNIGDDEAPAFAGDVNVGGTVQQIAAGGGFTCALLTSGAVRCWGFGEDGRLGYGNTISIGDDETPASAGDVPLL